jgi:hypothetical protein
MYRAIDGRFDASSDGLEIHREPNTGSVTVGFRGVRVASYTGDVDQFHLASALRNGVKDNLRSYLRAFEKVLMDRLRVPPGTELVFSVDQEMEFFDLAASTTHTFELRDFDSAGVFGEIRIHSHKPGATLSLQSDFGAGEERLLSAAEALIVNRSFSGLVDNVVKMSHRAFARYYARSGHRAVPGAPENKAVA